MAHILRDKEPQHIFSPPLWRNCAILVH